MGSAMQGALQFLPGAMATGAGAMTHNPMLAAMGTNQLIGAANPGMAGAGGTPGGTPLNAAGGTAPGAAGAMNPLAQLLAPMIGTAGMVMANRPQGQQPMPMPAKQAPAPQPMTLQAPVGLAQNSSPMQTFAAYRNFLNQG